MIDCCKKDGNLKQNLYIIKCIILPKQRIRRHVGQFLKSKCRIVIITKVKFCRKHYRRHFTIIVIKERNDVQGTSGVRRE